MNRLEKLDTILRRGGPDSDVLVLWSALATGLAVSALVAYWIGKQQIFYLYVAFIMVVSLTLIIGLQRRVWVLILLGWSVTGATAMFSVPLSGRDMSVLVTACAYLVYRVVSGDPMRQRWRALDGILVVNVAYLAFTLLLNPVGLRSFGAETIGARPYFTIALALVGYWIIWRLPNSAKIVSRVPLFILAGTGVVTLLYALGYFFPSLPSRIPILYMALDVEAYFGSYYSQGLVVRYKELGFFGLMLLMTLFAYCPSLAILNPLRPRFFAALLGAVCILVSGFRGLLGSACVLFGLTVWVRHGLSRFLMASLVGAALLLGLAAGQGRLYNLPFSAQRSLSFMPGKWNEDVVLDAQYSSQARFKWWRDAIEYGWIKNWWFGDGFGASAADWALAQGRSNTEMASLTGALHSGPLTAIRYVGIIGLALFYFLSVTSAVYSYRCVQKCRGTLLQPVAIYLAIQCIWFPINYTLVFGAYNVDMPQQVFLAALVRIVMRMAENLPSGNTPVASTSRPSASRPLMATPSMAKVNFGPAGN